jgi:2-oxoacid:acceptor oxidoreductase gamma subunit (pyruvate/2-ketoisovalerate family)
VSTRTLTEITIHGRGGQGAQVGAQILAGALFRSGREVQAFAAYGGERRGAPVTAYVRADESTIHLRSDITQADHLLVLDVSLLPTIGPGALREHGVVVVNSPVAPCGWMPGSARVVPVDAFSIARRAGLGPIVATPVLGAFAGATDLVSLDALLAAVEEWSPTRKRENVAACAEAYHEAVAAERARS